MPGFGNAFRQGREQARAARGAPPLQPPPRPPRGEPWNTGPHSEADEWADDVGQPPAARAELEAALRERDSELAASKRLLDEMADDLEQLQAAVIDRDSALAEKNRVITETADYAEQLKARVIELITGTEAMAKTLLLPGVKTFLLQRFHPDKHPNADDQKRAIFTEALKTINAAYDLADQLQTSE